MPASRVPSWTVLGDDDAPVDYDRALRVITNIETATATSATEEQP
jgi:hypothetical protein